MTPVSAGRADGTGFTERTLRAYGAALDQSSGGLKRRFWVSANCVAGMNSNGQSSGGRAAALSAIHPSACRKRATKALAAHLPSVPRNAGSAPSRLPSGRTGVGNGGSKETGSSVRREDAGPRLIGPCRRTGEAARQRVPRG